jgi:hypothetical protein
MFASAPAAVLSTNSLPNFTIYRWLERGIALMKVNVKIKAPPMVRWRQ